MAHRSGVRDVPETVEHFPELQLFKVVQLSDSYVLVNRTANGRFDLHTNLTFHGGPGSTLEMRVFSRADTVRLLQDAGFIDVQVYGEPVPQWGIYRPHA